MMVRRDTEERTAILDRRTGNRVAIIGLLLAALVNVITVVWFAASLQAAVSGLTASNVRRDATDAKRDASFVVLASQVAEISRQLAVISDRVMRNSDRLDRR
jgi:hypothetical protein